VKVFSKTMTQAMLFCGLPKRVSWMRRRWSKSRSTFC